MHIAYLYDYTTKEYLGAIERQLDPVGSALAGHDIYLMPADSTLIEPPVAKEGFKRIWNPDQEEWEYKEVQNSLVPKPYVPTELEKAYDNMYAAKQKLTETDYVNDKISDAVNTGDEELAAELRTKYAPTFAQRTEWREEVRHWEAEIERLEAEESAE